MTQTFKTRDILVLLMPFFLIFTSCKKENEMGNTGSVGIKVNFKGIEFPEEIKGASGASLTPTITTKSKSSSRSVNLNSPSSGQTEIRIDDNYVLVASISTGEADVEQALVESDMPLSDKDLPLYDKRVPSMIVKGQNGRFAKSNVSVINRKIKFRLIVFKQDGTFVGQKVYTTGSQYPDNESEDWKLNGGETYKFVAYSLNEDIAPPIYDKDNPESWIDVSGDKEFMYFTTEKTISKQNTTNLDLILKHRNSRIKFEFNSSAINVIRKIEGSVYGHRRSNRFRPSIDHKAVEYIYSTESLPTKQIAFEGLGSFTPIGEVNYTAPEGNAVFKIDKMEIDAAQDDSPADRPTTSIRENLELVIENIKPGTRYNIKLNVVRKIHKAVQIASGRYQTLILSDKGEVFGSGYIPYGLGIPKVGGHEYVSEFVNISLRNPNIGKVRKITVGYENTFLLTETGELFVSGRNRYGEMGQDNSLDLKHQFAKVTFVSGKVKEIFCSSWSTFIQTEDGRVFATGYNKSGQLGIGDYTNRFAFTEIASLRGYEVEDISGGEEHTLVKTRDGKILMSGSNTYFQMGPTTTPSTSVFQEISNAVFSGNVKEAKAAEWGSLVITKSGELYATGWNQYGQLGFSETGTNYIKGFTKVPSTFQGKVKDVFPYIWHTLVLTNDNELYGSGYNGRGALGLGDKKDRWEFTKIPFPSPSISRILESASAAHSIVSDTQGSVYGFGYNYWGQLGYADYKDKLVIVKLPIQLQASLP